MYRHVFLTGPPGIGKTTLIHKASEALKSSGTPIDGFYTEEVRQGGRRIGFDVITLSGIHGILARTGTIQSDGKHEYRVGQYVVDIRSFEHLVLPILDCMQLKTGSLPQKYVCIIDEIGKMELFSQKFISVVHKILDSANAVVFGTIPVPKAKHIPFVEEIRYRQDVKVFNITKENRDYMLQEIVTSVQKCI